VDRQALGSSPSSCVLGHTTKAHQTLLLFKDLEGSVEPQCREKWCSYCKRLHTQTHDPHTFCFLEDIHL
jgi:hypothetical protein